MLLPQDQTVPSALRARTQPSMPPPVMATTPERLETWTGVVRVPPKTLMPSWPWVLSPQDQTVPSALSARLVYPAALTATTAARLETGPGVVLSVNVPLPSWP